MTKLTSLAEKLTGELNGLITSIDVANDEITLETELAYLKSALFQLRDHEAFAFEQLIDLCAVDYLLYGDYDWETEEATENGFSRGVERQEAKAYSLSKPRFAVVYHLLSIKLNQRIRVKVFVEESHLIVPSVHEIWKGANWFEREAYDLFGILFDGHPDLRRILTDYGFIGHPFRKDFPLSGHVEMRYDARLQKVIYEPVDIEARILVPKVIRNDNRYLGPKNAGGEQ
ncbi:NADH-quinone oxidoreductase subunit C [Legionella jordanis]|uniref:NADH-quinone oxidoreductase subunit C n=1 Tax=Legionella jordanis TaxID=456 RepID=A0A0W0VDD8_9GAMM|nr:NADH-quinone oxidoreductase subunit C [Legionella jordanis]KTD18128.1 NADH dehydrogenase I chain C [Legionella jordanis]RMX00562.1 NADH-quinone oxidoreductase subunit C [Legionella jordanis]RMX21321.1 NADH-quinone oxidoreductase subunit C [Legionella jordanis]VEH13779.1 NADH dehydrogenase I chain C [Legionella jordanis]HAT8714162.1 NADH-quinone oxidoreductase subunit C [Legionella jordanis]